MIDKNTFSKIGRAKEHTSFVENGKHSYCLKEFDDW